MEKIKEWSDANKYSSFNSYKGLTYYEHYKKIVAWLDGGELPAPIEASLDPISACNQNCYYCNSQRYLPAKFKWDGEYIKDTLNYLSEWGVKAFCWGGGGEALLNENIKGMTAYGVNLGMECSIITNGVLMDSDVRNELQLCRWVGISLDSADPEVYRKVRGSDDCLKVLDNIKWLALHRQRTDICIKALVLPETIDTLLYTGKVAKELGVQDFHVRPVDLERKDFTGERAELDMEKVHYVFSQLHELEGEDFHVHTVTHKYDNEFHVKHDFNKCLASPLVVQICSDKKMYVCVDHRMEERFEIKEWGSNEHRALLKDIDPAVECARCTWSEYNKQVTAIESDSMCVSFP
ncbi:hypothetical protein LCGC14_0931490 [marine sediment metagenome]|uniref:Radical SAM core domain-containing protein n=1 Tax=marine sediment metagenome TaxID=412755 RepID=A0A0F9NMZ2_9ZZZZ